MWGYTEALRSRRQVLDNAGDDPGEIALHWLRIGEATTLAGGAELPLRVIQRIDGSRQKHPRVTPEICRRMRIWYLVN